MFGLFELLIPKLFLRDTVRSIILTTISFMASIAKLSNALAKKSSSMILELIPWQAENMMCLHVEVSI